MKEIEDMGERRERTWSERVVGSLRHAVSSDGDAFVILRGQREAVVHGCRRIMLYTPTEIRLRMQRRKQLSVRGNALSCSSFSGGAVTVEGEIVSVCFVSDIGEGETP